MSFDLNRLAARGWSLGVILLLLGIWVSPAEAQTPTPLAFWQYSAGQVLTASDDDAPKWRIIVGPSAVYLPEYEGSDNYELMPGAIVNIRYRDRYYLSTGEGLGFDAIRRKNYRVGVSVAYSRGRDDDVDGLYGMGGIDFAPQLRIYGEYVLRPRLFASEWPVIVAADARRAFHSWQGYSANIGVYAPVLGSREERYFVFLGGAASFSGDETVDTFFGVTPAQSARTGYPTYDPRRGLTNINIGVTSGWAITKHLLLNGNVGTKRLLSDASESPIVQEEWQFLFSVSVGYIF